MAIEHLQEWAAVRGTVDRQRGIIRGVRILNRESRNGRTYSREAIERAAGLYEGAKVYVNHPQGSAVQARDFHDLLGRLRNVAVSGDGLTGDLHANPKHPVFEQLAWAAEHEPEGAGLSHNVEARTRRSANGRQVVEQILRVVSVDLVADPATTSGLFESIEGERHPLDDPETFAAAMRGEVGTDVDRFTEAVAGVPEPDELDEFVRALRKG